MDAFELTVERPLTLAITGKFVAPSPDWVHLSRVLHDFELIVMTSGTLYIACGEKRFAISQGEYLILPPFASQYGYRPSQCSFYWLHFTAGDAARAIPCEKRIDCNEHIEPIKHIERAAPNTLLLPQAGTLAHPEKIIVMMKQLQDAFRSYQDQTTNNYMTTVILCELYNQLAAASRPSGKSKQEQLYHDIVDYIKWNRSQHVKVSQIADHFGYNEKYLSHLFSQKSGMSIKQYMLQQKMDLAKFLLTDTNNNISEISIQLGYKDCHSFMKSFKKKVGLTPSEYRNAYAKRMLFYE